MPDLLLDKELATFLDAQAFTDSDSVQAVVRAGIELPTPDFHITVLLESGPPPTTIVGETNSFTVRVRHLKAEEANLQMRAVFRVLHEYQGRVGSLAVGRIQASAGPVQLGRTQQEGSGKGRYVVSQTFTAITEQF